MAVSSQLALLADPRPHEFVELVSSRAFKKKLTTSQKEVLGEVRAMLRELPQLVSRVLPFLEATMRTMCEVTAADDSGDALSSWEFRWKKVSYEGFDLIKNVYIDYGNVEYSCLLGAFCLLDAGLMNHLVVLSQRWPAVNPFTHTSDDAYSMQGDVMEVALAALRANELFMPRFNELLIQHAISLPEVYNAFCRICRMVQDIDCLVFSAKVKWRQAYVQKIALPEWTVLEFVAQWRDPRQRPHCLRSLLAFGTR